MGYNDVIIGDVYDVWVGVCMLCGATTKKLSTHTPTKPQKLTVKMILGGGAKKRCNNICQRCNSRYRRLNTSEKHKK